MTNLDNLSIFFSIGSVGIISFLILRLLSTLPVTQGRLLLSATLLCFASYLLLAMPYSKEIFQQYRWILLVLTELAPLLLWFLSLKLFEGLFETPKWFLLVLFVIILWGVVDVSSTGYMGHWPIIHNFMHWVEACALLHVVFMAIHGLKNDLVENRRLFRVILVIFITLQILFAIIIEITDSDLKYSQYYSLLNSLILFVAINLFALHISRLSESAATGVLDTPTKQVHVAPENEFSAKEKTILSKIERFVAEKQFTQNELTISKLAEQLQVSEHELRKVINRGLGYRNFSSFLNAHRLKMACEQLTNPDCAHLPILTIALGVGYGSIAPFNRAFKQHTDMTPSQYRENPTTR